MQREIGFNKTVHIFCLGSFSCGDLKIPQKVKYSLRIWVMPLTRLNNTLLIQKSHCACIHHLDDIINSNSAVVSGGMSAGHCLAIMAYSSKQSTSWGRVIPGLISCQFYSPVCIMLCIIKYVIALHLSAYCLEWQNTATIQWHICAVECYATSWEQAGTQVTARDGKGGEDDPQLDLY